MTGKTKKLRTLKDGFLRIRSINDAFPIRFIELFLLSVTASTAYIYFPDSDILIILAIAIPIVTLVSYILYKVLIRRNQQTVQSSKSHLDNAG